MVDKQSSRRNAIALEKNGEKLVADDRERS
jgi:hypothetical protein